MFSRFRHIFSKSKNEKEHEPETVTDSETINPEESQTVFQPEESVRDASEIAKTTENAVIETKKLVQDIEKKVSYDPNLALAEDIEKIKPGTVITLENSIVETEVVDVVELLADGEGKSEIVMTEKETEQIKINETVKKCEPKTIVTVTFVKTEKIPPTESAPVLDESIQNLESNTDDIVSTSQPAECEKVLSASNTSLNVDSDSPKPTRAHSYELLREPLSYIEKLEEVNQSPILKKKTLIEPLSHAEKKLVPQAETVVIKDNAAVAVDSKINEKETPTNNYEVETENVSASKELKPEVSNETHDTTSAVLLEGLNKSNKTADEYEVFNAKKPDDEELYLNTERDIAIDIINAMLEQALQDATTIKNNTELLVKSGEQFDEEDIENEIDVDRNDEIEIKSNNEEVQNPVSEDLITAVNEPDEKGMSNAAQTKENESPVTEQSVAFDIIALTPPALTKENEFCDEEKIKPSVYGKAQDFERKNTEEEEAYADVEFTLPIAKKHFTDPIHTLSQPSEDNKADTIDVDTDCTTPFMQKARKEDTEDIEPFKSAEVIEEDPTHLEPQLSDGETDVEPQLSDGETDVDVAFTLPLVKKNSAGATKLKKDAVELKTLAHDEELEPEIKQEEITFDTATSTVAAIATENNKINSVEPFQEEAAEVDVVFTLPILKKNSVDSTELRNPLKAENDDVGEADDVGIEFTIPLAKMSSKQTIDILKEKQNMNEATSENEALENQLEDAVDVDVAFTLPFVNKNSVDPNEIMKDTGELDFSNKAEKVEANFAFTRPSLSKDLDEFVKFYSSPQVDDEDDDNGDDDDFGIEFTVHLPKINLADNQSMVELKECIEDTEALVEAEERKIPHYEIVQEEAESNSPNGSIAAGGLHSNLQNVDIKITENPSIFADEEAEDSVEKESPVDHDPKALDVDDVKSESISEEEAVESTELLDTESAHNELKQEATKSSNANSDDLKETENNDLQAITEESESVTDIKAEVESTVHITAEESEQRSKPLKTTGETELKPHLKVENKNAQELYKDQVTQELAEVDEVFNDSKVPNKTDDQVDALDNIETPSKIDSANRTIMNLNESSNTSDIENREMEDIEPNSFNITIVVKKPPADTVENPTNEEAPITVFENFVEDTVTDAEIPNQNAKQALTISSEETAKHIEPTKETTNLSADDFKVNNEIQNITPVDLLKPAIDFEKLIEPVVSNKFEVDDNVNPQETENKNTINSLESNAVTEKSKNHENIEVALGTAYPESPNKIEIDTVVVVEKINTPLDTSDNPNHPNFNISVQNDIPSLFDNKTENNTFDNITQSDNNVSNNSSAMSDDLNNDVTSPSTDSGNGGSELNTTAATDASTAATLIVTPTGNNAIACNAISNKLSEISEIAESLDAVIRDTQEDPEGLVETNSTGSSNDKKLENMHSNSCEDWHSRSTEDESFGTASEGGNFTPHSHSSSFQTASGRTSSFISSDKNSFDASEADDSTFAFDIPDIPELLTVPHNHLHNISLDSSDHSFLSAQQSPSPTSAEHGSRVRLIPIEIEPRSDPEDHEDHEEDGSVVGVEELHSQSVTPTPGDNHFESIPIESEHEWEHEAASASGGGASVSCIADAPSMEILTELTPMTLSMTPEVSIACPNASAAVVDASSNQLGVINANTNPKPNAAWRRNKYYENITKQTIKGFL